MAQILEERECYGTDYPALINFAEEQTSILWTADEIEVEKDIHELRTNCTAAEYHGIVSVLLLFVHYEVNVGNNYWRDYICKHFPRPDVQRMASVFAMFELNIHAPFYNKINELLGLDNPEFYLAYLDDPILKDRMEWLEKVATQSETTYDKLKSVGVFSMIEGAILYSSFAFLKHFNNNGKNKFQNINAGINFSAIDENIHSQAGAYLFNTLYHEAIEAEEYLAHEKLANELEITAWILFEHEKQIIKKIFDKGDIPGINALMLENFVQSRLDICLERLGYPAIFEPKYNPIADWFYLDIESSTLHDTFIAQGNDYRRDWAEAKFTWTPKNV
jgi:ribonucleotide reductase beta subunit family protein with ferritin-like domain